MPLPTLRKRQETLNIREAETYINDNTLYVTSDDPDHPPTRHTLEGVDSPLNDSLQMLVDLAQDIQVYLTLYQLYK